MTFHKISLIIFFTLLTIGNCFSQQGDTLRYTEQGYIGFSEKKIVTVLPDDTTYFCIALKDQKTSVKLRGKWTQLSDNKQLSKFIKTNRSRIDEKKILVIAPSKAKYNEFNFVLDAFKDNDLLNFHLVPTD